MSEQDDVSTKTKELLRVYIVAGVVLKKDDAYLLVQENRPDKPDVHQYWNFPAGRVEKGDTLEQTAIREAKEEVGLEVELLGKIGLYQISADVPVKHAFEGKITGGKIVWPKSEILDAQWFSWKQIQEMRDQLRDPWVLEAIQALQERENK